MTNLKMTILVVDDDRSIRILLEALLTRLGYNNVLLCSSRADALDIIGRNHIDGAFIDLVLGDGTGIDVAKACDAKNIPVVFCTSTNDSHNLTNMYRLGWVINKPVLPASVERATEYFSCTCSH